MSCTKSVKDKVKEFIERRFLYDCLWTKGNCYFFALILKDVFGGRILYDEIYGHFVTEIEGEMYDHTGLYTPKGGEAFVAWDELKEQDSSHYERIRKDCCT